MKFYKYIIASLVIHIALLSGFSLRRIPHVALGISGGEVSLYLQQGETGRGNGSPDYSEPGIDSGNNGQKAGLNKGDGLSDGDESGGGGDSSGTVSRIVADAYRNSPPVYPRIARAMGYQGVVTLNLEVMPDGRCGSVYIAKSSGYDVLDAAALQAARGWTFFTGRSIIISSPVEVTQDIIFVLKNY